MLSLEKEIKGVLAFIYYRPELSRKYLERILEEKRISPTPKEILSLMVALDLLAITHDGYRLTILSTNILRTENIIRQ